MYVWVGVCEIWHVTPFICVICVFDTQLQTIFPVCQNCWWYAGIGYIPYCE